MPTIALWVIVWTAIALVLLSLVSMSGERASVFGWKDEIADELHEQFNVDYRVAYKIVDETFPTISVMYKTQALGSTKLIALRLFWRKADESGWMPHHFANRIMPDELYKHPSWGGIIVEA